MKFLATLVAVFMFVSVLEAFTWYNGETITLSWNPVTTLESGKAIPPGDSIWYELTYIDIAGNRVDAVVEGFTEEVSLPATCGEGEWVFGVRPVRVRPVGTKIVGPWSWSNDQVAPFGLRYLNDEAPASVTGLSGPQL